MPAAHPACIPVVGLAASHGAITELAAGLLAELVKGGFVEDFHSVNPAAFLWPPPPCHFAIADTSTPSPHDRNDHTRLPSERMK